MTSRRLLTIALLPLLLGGCAVGPDYKAPEIQSPEAWRVETPTDAPVVANIPWWEIFHDEDLQELVKTGLENNKDLKMALARFDQARAALGISDAAFLPSVNYNGGAYRTRGRSGPGTTNFDGFSLGGSVQWELDLWGRIRRLNEAATAQYLAAEENKNAVVLTLVSEIANSYFTLRQLDAQLAISEQTAQTRKSAYELVKSKLDSGVGTIIDTRQFEAEMLSAQATISEFTRAVALQENALSILTGKNPGEIRRKQGALTTPVLPQIPAGIPSELLQRRPDVRAAELQVRASNAEIGAAIAEYFPKISLTGALGFVNPSLGNLLEHDSMGRQGGGGLLGPIFNGGAIYYSVKQAEARTRETVAAYELTTLNAFREVNDALVSIQTTRERITFLEKQVVALTEALEKTRLAYNEGTLNFLTVLDADRNLFTAQLLLASARTTELTSAVQLYKALGGGWRTQDQKPLVDGTGKIKDGPGASAQENQTGKQEEQEK